MQENGRYALRLLSREVAMSGFLGGIPPSVLPAPVPVGTDCSDMNWVLDGAHSLELVNDYRPASPPISLHGTTLTCLDGASIAANTDLIAIKRSAAAASLRRGIPAAGLTLSPVENWYLRLAAGAHPRWEKLSTAQLRDPEPELSSLSYWQAMSQIFFIRRYSDSGDSDDDVPTLCVETLAGDGMTTRCLIEGVENMQFEFGIDTDADGVPNEYKSAPLGNEMDRAITARIHLLLRSVNRIAGHRDDKSYMLGPSAVQARHDPYLRRVVSTTVALGNQLKAIN
ncbi:MAG: PilW family protein [Halioglobus sp.]